MSSDPGNPSSVSGGSFSVFDYNLTVAEDAPTGKIRVYQRVSYSDANIDLLNPVYQSAILDSFICRQAAVIELAALTPSQTTVTVSQTSLWSVRMDITNSGNSPLVISFNPNATYIRFSKTEQTKQANFTLTNQHHWTVVVLRLIQVKRKVLHLILNKMEAKQALLP